MSPWSIENERVQCSPCAGMPKSTVFHTDIYTLHIPFHSITLHHITLQYTKQYTLPKDRAVLLSSCFTRRTARARSLDHQPVTRPRLQIIEAKMQGFSTGYLRALSGTIEYNCESREVGCELRRSNNSARSLVTREHLSNASDDVKTWILELTGDIFIGLSPSILKLGAIAPLPKDSKRFRPITLLEPITKLVTGTVARRMSLLFHTNFLLHHHQFGFVHGGSCEAPIED